MASNNTLTVALSSSGRRVVEDADKLTKVSGYFKARVPSTATALGIAGIALPWSRPVSTAVVPLDDTADEIWDMYSSYLKYGLSTHEEVDPGLEAQVTFELCALGLRLDDPVYFTWAAEALAARMVRGAPGEPTALPDSWASTLLKAALGVRASSYQAGISQISDICTTSTVHTKFGSALDALESAYNTELSWRKAAQADAGRMRTQHEVVQQAIQKAKMEDVKIAQVAAQHLQDICVKDDQISELQADVTDMKHQLAKAKEEAVAGAVKVFEEKLAAEALAEARLCALQDLSACIVKLFEYKSQVMGAAVGATAPGGGTKKRKASDDLTASSPGAVDGEGGEEITV